MCYESKVASKRSRKHSKGSNGRRKTFRATYRNLDLWEIDQEYSAMEG
jgi:hypothetical protein